MRISPPQAGVRAVYRYRLTDGALEWLADTLPDGAGWRANRHARQGRSPNFLAIATAAGISDSILHKTHYGDIPLSANVMAHLEALGERLTGQSVGVVRATLFVRVDIPASDTEAA